jgi:hypothetical protein
MSCMKRGLQRYAGLASVDRPSRGRPENPLINHTSLRALSTSTAEGSREPMGGRMVNTVKSQEPWCRGRQPGETLKSANQRPCI